MARAEAADDPRRRGRGASARDRAAGADLLAGCAGGILTHCNTGALAARGTRHGARPSRSSSPTRRPITVLACETRPLLQGARLTVWELRRAGIAHALLVDGAAAGLIRRGEVDAVIVGCDRVAANGDVANKVGTYAHALAARAAGIPFVVAGPTSTIDPAIADRRGDRHRGARRRRGAPRRRCAAHRRHAVSQPRLRRHPGRARHRARDRAGIASPVTTESVMALLASIRRRRRARPATAVRRNLVRIARSTSTTEVALEELADPVPGPGEVVCRVLACGVCGSDVSDAYVSKKLPIVLGHEVGRRGARHRRRRDGGRRRRPRDRPPPRAVR